MDKEIEYKENFVKTTRNPNHVIQAVKECHPSNYGWEVGEPKIEKLNNGEYKVTIPLIKYRIQSKSR